MGLTYHTPYLLRFRGILKRRSRKIIRAPQMVDNIKETVFLRHNVSYTYELTVIVTACTDSPKLKQDKNPSVGKERHRHETYH